MTGPCSASQMEHEKDRGKADPGSDVGAVVVRTRMEFPLAPLHRGNRPLPSEEIADQA